MIFILFILRTAKQGARKKEATSAGRERNARQIIHQICKTIKGHSPTLFDRIAQQVKGPRKRKGHNLAEIPMAAVTMSLFRESPRNSFNSGRGQETFIKNHERMFGLRLPHMPA